MMTSSCWPIGSALPKYFLAAEALMTIELTSRSALALSPRSQAYGQLPRLPIKAANPNPNPRILMSVLILSRSRLRKAVLR
jgi:hypothetical protein